VVQFVEPRLFGGAPSGPTGEIELTGTHVLTADMFQQHFLL
jgi:hypothetical protein